MHVTTHDKQNRNSAFHATIINHLDTRSESIIFRRIIKIFIFVQLGRGRQIEHASPTNPIDTDRINKHMHIKPRRLGNQTLLSSCTTKLGKQSGRKTLAKDGWEIGHGDQSACCCAKSSRHCPQGSCRWAHSTCDSTQSSCQSAQSTFLQHREHLPVYQEHLSLSPEDLPLCPEQLPLWSWHLAIVNRENATEYRAAATIRIELATVA